MPNVLFLFITFQPREFQEINSELNCELQALAPGGLNNSIPLQQLFIDEARI
jgi:hypothetical protein